MHMIPSYDKMISQIQMGDRQDKGLQGEQFDENNDSATC